MNRDVHMLTVLHSRCVHIYVLRSKVTLLATQQPQISFSGVNPTRRPIVDRPDWPRTVPMAARPIALVELKTVFVLNFRSLQRNAQVFFVPPAPIARGTLFGSFLELPNTCYDRKYLISATPISPPHTPPASHGSRYCIPYTTDLKNLRRNQ